MSLRGFHTGNRCAEREWEMELLTRYRLLEPIAAPVRESSTNSRKAMNILSIFENCSPSTAQREIFHSALPKTFHDEGVSCDVVVKWPI
jgi:hypothetical protein